MSTTSTVLERLRGALSSLDCGVLELVDDLLDAASQQRLRVDWHEGRCRVCLPETAQEDTVEVPLRRSVFRAALARVAALCNEHRPNSVSPYGGEGQLRAPGDAAPVIRAVFTNTPGEQSLELTRSCADQT
jgi:hypothetical protein